MILADTSVWIEHFRRGSASFARRLEQGEVAIHTVIIGELATGNLSRREETLRSLQALPRLREGTSAECLHYLETISSSVAELAGMIFNWRRCRAKPRSALVARSRTRLHGKDSRPSLSPTIG